MVTQRCIDSFSIYTYFKAGSMVSSAAPVQDGWFLVLDPDAVTLGAPAETASTFGSAADQQARRYQQNSLRFTGSLGFGEVWSILNPFSIVQFLRYAMADVL